MTERREYQEERDAEKQYRKDLKAARVAAKALAADDARSESERVVAAETADALKAIEDAATVAEREPEAMAVTKTFRQRLRAALGF